MGRGKPPPHTSPPRRLWRLDISAPLAPRQLLCPQLIFRSRAPGSVILILVLDTLMESGSVALDLTLAVTRCSLIFVR